MVSRCTNHSARTSLHIIAFPCLLSLVSYDFEGQLRCSTWSLISELPQTGWWVLPHFKPVRTKLHSLRKVRETSKFYGESMKSSIGDAIENADCCGECGKSYGESMKSSIGDAIENGDMVIAVTNRENSTINLWNHLLVMLLKMVIWWLLWWTGKILWWIDEIIYWWCYWEWWYGDCCDE